MHPTLLPSASILLFLSLLSLNPNPRHANAAAIPLPTPQLYHHCLDQKHKFYQFCCETVENPDCDGVHGPKNPLKKGEHDKNWEEGPPPPEVEDAGGDGGGGGGDGGGEGEGEGGGDGGGDGGGGGEGGE